MTDFEVIQKLVPNSHSKTVLEIGSHDDTLTKQLGKVFKSVDSLYEFSKIDDYIQGNITVRKTPYSSVLPLLKNYDVILMMNEFHHFPDIMQMQTYDALGEIKSNQIKS